MQRDVLETHTDNIMRCKKCGTEHKYFEVVSFMDSCELPGNLVWMNGCTKCGAIDYEEIDPRNIRN